MSIPNKPADVRFAPSPTGLMHIGSARTALYNYLLARQSGGAFILRIEDTDQKRFQDNSEGDFNSALSWLGIHQMKDLNREVRIHLIIKQSGLTSTRSMPTILIKNGFAFYCFCSSREITENPRRTTKTK